MLTVHSGSLVKSTDITALVHRSRSDRRQHAALRTHSDDVIMTEDQWMMDHDHRADDDDGDTDDGDTESVDSEEDGLRQLLLLQQTKYQLTYIICIHSDDMHTYMTLSD